MSLITFLFFLIPFDLPISEFLHATLHASLSSFYLLFLPTSMLAIVFILIYRSRKGMWSVTMAAWVFSGFMGIVGVINGSFSSIDTALRDAWLGYAAPAILTCVLVNHSSRQRLVSSFLLGWIVYLSIGVGALAFTVWQGYKDNSPWSTLEYMDQWRFFRYEMMNDGNIYAIWLGNANKASNLILIIMAIAPLLLCLDGTKISRSHMLAIFLLSGFHILILCSRLGLLLFPFVFLACGYSSYIRRIFYVLLIVFLISIWNNSFDGFLDGIKKLFVDSNEKEGITWLSTYAQKDGRFDQWSHIFQTWTFDPASILFGLGSGEYGMVYHDYPEAETHNYFLDRLLSAGVLGLGGVFVAITTAWRKARLMNPHSRRIVRLSILIFVLISFREFSPAYLFGTSLGGVVVCIMLELPSMVIKRSSVSISSSSIAQF